MKKSTNLLVVLTLTLIPTAALFAELCVGNYQTEDQAKAQLARFAASYLNRADWQKRAATIRQGILNGAGLNPLPEKTPLNPIIRKKRLYNGYSRRKRRVRILPRPVRHRQPLSPQHPTRPASLPSRGPLHPRPLVQIG